MKGTAVRQSIWVLSLCLNLGHWMTGWQPAAAQRGKGYQLTSRRVVVDSSSHWQNWTMPTHAVEVTPSGRVQPHFFRWRYNILDDLGTFRRKVVELKRKKEETPILNIDSTETLDVRGQVVTEKKKGQEVPVYTYFYRLGISRVGSNPEVAAHILDGDPSTYWEPDPRDPLDKWWIEVDLGRVVPVDQLVLRFVDEELGDPFRQFRVLAAPDQAPILQNDDKINFQVVARTHAPNRDQREFQFPLVEPGADPNWKGRLVETLRISVSDTKAGRATRVSEAEWQALDPDSQGDIVYFIKAQEGFEEPVDQAVYESLPADRQGHKEFYIRERPRLADIEVWGLGDNLSAGMMEGGGSVFLSGGNFSPGVAFDGDFSTFFTHRIKLPTVDRDVVTVDLGAAFWLDALGISALKYSLIDGYITRSADGSLDTRGQLKWHRISPREREDNSADQFNPILDIYDPPLKLRFVEIYIVSSDPGRLANLRNGPDIAEYQFFAQGYPAEVVLTSDLIELPVGRSFGRLTWEAETPPGTSLEIHTRTGDLLDKHIRYFDKSGTEIAQDTWDNLLGSFKGPIDTTFVPGSGWSPWSRKYAQPGERVASPDQRRFLQIQVKLTTEDRLAAASISSIAIDLLDPVAERLLAEVRPLEIAAPGQLDTFEVFIRPLFVESPVRARSVGFDELLLSLSSAHGLELLDLSLDVDEQTSQATRVFHPSASGAFTTDSGDHLEVLADKADSIWVRLPAPVQALPAAASVQTYYRITTEGEQVPVDEGGELLTEASYGLLEDEERGDIRYFRKEVDARGQVRLTQVDQPVYDDLEEGEGEIRYFRTLLGAGAQFPFNPDGDSLTSSTYDSLPVSERGRIASSGPLLRVRFAARIFRNGATLKLAARNTADGADGAAWQSVEPGDATSLVPGDALSIHFPIDPRILGDFTIAPNPFTPNEDGINDAAGIRFSVFKLGKGAEATVRIYSLDGRRLWEISRTVHSGQEAFLWPGTDSAGQQVPPGIYICRVELDIDAEEAGHTTLLRLIHVAY
ncbi:MAG: hypothetical protein HYW07_22140 [Candidatus Latescibacteria bacterium]|nr:hypothetical protein [Candidatus Latescibacterota bacterium]